ncbi:hypothetical protein [Embleya hyalina]|uniref:ATP/GTP-binding protein n=1 Tax=Embleya hyalina TaxID=516124 RepID=A0A401YSM1_9ACTN|nr:hypothetical protein [Embleya hyalina]GCD97566.1 ATP/GTP-binding protein [Embleya hyalina]
MATRRALRSAAIACTVGVSAALLVLPSANADVNQCGNLIICIDIRVPGGSTGGGTGGATGGGAEGGTGEVGFPPDSGIGGNAGNTAGQTGNNAPPPIAPADVALMALAQLKLERPQIKVNPADGKLGLVGLPVWMWIDSPAANVWSSAWLSKELKVGDVSVTVFARSAKIEWDMGDGSKILCDGPGRPYQPSDLNKMGPCSHKYTTTSKGGVDDKFTVTATVFWDAYYVDASGRHNLPGMTGANSTTVRIGELQVVN